MTLYLLFTVSLFPQWRQFTISLPSAVVTIGFDATPYTFIETDSTVSRSVSVSVQGSTTLARGVVVTVQTVDGSATGEALIHRHCTRVIHVLSFLPPASSDYTTVSMDLTFSAGNTNQTVMIPITGDTVEEGTESFTVSLTTGDSAVMLNPSTTTVTIEDDDGKFFGIKEGGRRLICRDYTSLLTINVVNSFQHSLKPLLSIEGQNLLLYADPTLSQEKGIWLQYDIFSQLGDITHV